MKKTGLKLLLAGLAIACSNNAYAAVTVITNSEGIVTGAKGVLVDSDVYDVTFHNRCAEAYGSCSLSWNLPFKTEAGAQAAMVALSRQVFSVAPTPQTIGCVDLKYGCNSVLVFRKWDNPQADGFFMDVIKFRNPTAGSGVNPLVERAIYPDVDVYNSSFVQFSRPGSAVPEPGTWLTMVLGFGVFGALMRKARVRSRSSLA